MNVFWQALRERRERAVEVKSTYRITYAGLQAWVVEHPEEPGRIYFVDMIRRHCSCPDFVCTANGMAIECKHLIAVDEVWRKLTGRQASWFVHNDPATVEAREQQADFNAHMAELAKQDPFGD